MKRKIRILHVISDTNFGGAGRLIVNLSKSIDRQRFEFVFAIPDGSRLENILRQEGRVVCFKGEGDASFSFSNIPSLCRIIKDVKPDIVHTHSSLSGRIAAAVCGVNKAGRVYTKHCVFDCSNAKKSNLRRKIYNIFDDLLSGGVVAVADSAKQELVCEGVSQAKISVIINGSLPLERYCENQKNNIRSCMGISDSDFVVGIVARLEEYKGHKTFLHAASLAQKDGENIKFIIMGDGSRREELETYSEQLGLKNTIFTGFVENVAEYMNILDINVNCSTGTETSCLAISEGLSLGIPAIVSDFGGNPNMVINGITGFVFSQNDANGLYKIIKELKNSPEIVKTMSENAYKDFENRFSAPKMAKNYEKFYINILNRK